MLCALRPYGKPILRHTGTRLTDLDVNDFLDFTTSWRDVVAVIEQVGMDSVADRISYLYGLANDDPNEVPIQLESLQRFALFIMGRQHLPRPRIGVNPDGIAQAVWRISEGGVLAMNFLPAGDIRFAVILRSSESKSIQRSISGVLPPDRVMYTILPYVDDLRR